MSLTSVPPGHPTPDDSGGGAKTDDHGGMGAPSPEAVRQGYEPDGYDTTSVVSVPILVVVFFVLAFVTTSILFAYFTRSQDYSDDHPMAAARNKAPLSERIGRINRGGEVDHPRLEPLRVREGDSRAITRPEAKSGNPPYLYPEDSRAEPGRTPELYRTGKVEGANYSRVSLATVIGAADKNLFPKQKAGTAPRPKWEEPTAANAGRGFGPSTAEPPPLPNPPEPKKDEPKKVDPKKDEKKGDAKAGDPKKEDAKKDEKKEPPKGPTPPEGKK